MWVQVPPITPQEVWVQVPPKTPMILAILLYISSPCHGPDFVCKYQEQQDAKYYAKVSNVLKQLLRRKK